MSKNSAIVILFITLFPDRPMLAWCQFTSSRFRYYFLATKRRSSAIHFSLRNQTCAYQFSNARIGQTVTMPTHAVFQTPSFQPHWLQNLR